jgi:hypothetical protein
MKITDRKRDVIELFLQSGIRSINDARPYREKSVIFKDLIWHCGREEGRLEKKSMTLQLNLGSVAKFVGHSDAEIKRLVDGFLRKQSRAIVKTVMAQVKFLTKPCRYTDIVKKFTKNKKEQEFLCAAVEYLSDEIMEYTDVDIQKFGRCLQKK